MKKTLKNIYYIFGNPKILFFLFSWLFSIFYEFLKKKFNGIKTSQSRNATSPCSAARTCSYYWAAPCRRREHIGGQGGAAPSARTPSFKSSSDGMLLMLFCREPSHQQNWVNTSSGSTANHFQIPLNTWDWYLNFYLHWL